MSNNIGSRAASIRWSDFIGGFLPCSDRHLVLIVSGPAIWQAKKDGQGRPTRLRHNRESELPAFRLAGLQIVTIRTYDSNLAQDTESRQ